MARTTKRGAGKQKPAPRSRVSAKASKKTKSKPKPKPRSKPRSTPRSTPARRATAKAARGQRVIERAAEAPPEVELGTIVVPSGELAIFDVGLLGYLPEDALAPTMVHALVPRDAPLRVVGERVGKGRFADCWAHVSIVLVPGGEPTHATKLGDAAVDFARILLADRAAIAAWQHDESLDGKADLLFWGRDAGPLARALRAPKANEGYGWTDLTVAEAETRWTEAERLKAENRWLLATDLRPHSHHFQMLEGARRAPTGASTLDLAGRGCCCSSRAGGTASIRCSPISMPTIARCASGSSSLPLTDLSVQVQVQVLRGKCR